MYVLNADNEKTLNNNSQLFEQHMEPLLKLMDAAHAAGAVPANLPEIPEYLLTCRWPFRRLEYSLALEVLLNHLKPGDRYLDAGSGATPLAWVMAKRDVQAEASDFNPRLVQDLISFNPDKVYGSSVKLERQDLTQMTYADNTFDAVSCISVIEHIPAPGDQTSVKEMLRILKPGGVLVLTLDYKPPKPAQADVAQPTANTLGAQIGKAAKLLSKGDIGGIVRGVGNKRAAQQVVESGAAKNARSANQSFEIAHLEQDLGPQFKGTELPVSFGYSKDLRSVTSETAYKFWQFDSIYQQYGDVQYRPILPVAFVYKK